jgi:hypothetical protein
VQRESAPREKTAKASHYLYVTHHLICTSPRITVVYSATIVRDQQKEDALAARMTDGVGIGQWRRNSGVRATKSRGIGIYQTKKYPGGT